MLKLNKKSGFNVLLAVIVGAAVLGAGFAAYVYRLKIREFLLNREREELPLAMTYQAATNTGAATKEATEKPVIVKQEIKAVELKPSPVLPEEVNLAVPFTVQAPFAVWDALHEDACEEASVLMVARYYRNQPIAGPQDADAEIYKLADWEDKNFGFNIDTSAELTARMLKEYYGFKNVAVKYDDQVSVDAVKSELALGRPVVVPNYGRALGNPFFRAPGPVYHMLVIKGYTKDGKFIVNDPGTKRGADFIYKQDTVMKAINDWDNEKSKLSGRRAMIVVY